MESEPVKLLFASIVLRNLCRQICSYLSISPTLNAASGSQWKPERNKGSVIKTVSYPASALTVLQVLTLNLAIMHIRHHQRVVNVKHSTVQ